MLTIKDWMDTRLRVTLTMDVIYAQIKNKTFGMGESPLPGRMYDRRYTGRQLGAKLTPCNQFPG